MSEFRVRRPATNGLDGGYSRKVPQRVRIPGDWQVLTGTVTCGDGRGWMCCRQMACKRSAVRARLAPQGQRLNSNRSNRQYSSEVPQPRPLGPPRVCSDRSSSRARAAGRTPDPRLRGGADQPATWANPRLIGPVSVAAWSLPGPAPTAISASDCCRICRWSRWAAVLAA